MINIYYIQQKDHIFDLGGFQKVGKYYLEYFPTFLQYTSKLIKNTLCRSLYSYNKFENIKYYIDIYSKIDFNIYQYISGIASDRLFQELKFSNKNIQWITNNPYYSYEYKIPWIPNYISRFNIKIGNNVGFYLNNNEDNEEKKKLLIEYIKNYNNDIYYIMSSEKDFLFFRKTFKNIKFIYLKNNIDFFKSVCTVIIPNSSKFDFLSVFLLEAITNKCNVKFLNNNFINDGNNFLKFIIDNNINISLKNYENDYINVFKKIQKGYNLKEYIVNNTNFNELKHVFLKR